MISYPWRFTDTMRNKSLDRSACPAKYSVCLSLSIVLTLYLRARASFQRTTANRHGGERVLRTGHGEAAFWHNGCSEFKLKRSDYTLTIRIRDVDPNTPKVAVTPAFERSDNYGP